jgi:hypothetical protein
MCIGLHVTNSLFLLDFNETWTFMTDLKKKCLYIKFHDTASCGSQVVPCVWMDGQTGGHDEADSPFHSFAIAPTL